MKNAAGFYLYFARYFKVCSYFAGRYFASRFKAMGV